MGVLSDRNIFSFSGSSNGKDGWAGEERISSPALIVFGWICCSEESNGMGGSRPQSWRTGSFMNAQINMIGTFGSFPDTLS